MIASDPRFAGIGPLDPNLIGLAAWYEVEPTTAGFRVTIRIGWGDCQAGCIDQHIWTYDVSVDGTITLVSETGPTLPPGIGGGGTTTGEPTLDVTLVAGPVCPVEMNPPDPNCAPRPVVGATVVIRDASGAEKARAASDQAGHVRIPLPAGAYTVEALDAPGLMATPSPMDVTVAAAGTTSVTLEYDTGIR